MPEALKIRKYLSDIPQFKPIKYKREYLMDCQPGNIISLVLLLQLNPTDLNNQRTRKLNNEFKTAEAISQDGIIGIKM